MKFSTAILAGFLTVEAGKGGKGGKHGNVDLESTRFNYQDPNCITGKGTCDDKGNEAATSGSFTLTPDMYQDKKNYIFQISLSQSRHISLQFDQSYGFEMEWHSKCGYDKVHIFTGNKNSYGDSKRVGRFCGPKQGLGDIPFDGTKNFKPAKNNDGNKVMALWDYPYNTQSNEVFIAIDLDQDFHDYDGFQINWTSELVEPPNWSDFGEVMEWTNNYVQKEINNLEFVNLAKASGTRQSALNYFERSVERSETNLKCNKDFAEPISAEVQASLSSLFDLPHAMENIELAMDAISDLMEEYMTGGPGRNCRAWKSWRNRANKVYRKVKNTVV